MATFLIPTPNMDGNTVPPIHHPCPRNKRPQDIDPKDTDPDYAKCSDYSPKHRFTNSKANHRLTPPDKDPQPKRTLHKKSPGGNSHQDLNGYRNELSLSLTVSSIIYFQKNQNQKQQKNDFSQNPDTSTPKPR
jgi:hypothetical protein